MGCFADIKNKSVLIKGGWKVVVVVGGCGASIKNKRVRKGCAIANS